MTAFLDTTICSWKVSLKVMCAFVSIHAQPKDNLGGHPTGTIFLMRCGLSLAWKQLSRLGWPYSNPSHLPVYISPEPGLQICTTFLAF